MTNSVKTTAIKKKYKDKQGNWKELTINHAKVKDRLKAFWEANPRGKIETSQQIDGKTLIFKALIVGDKKDEFSREATGHSYGNVGETKGFEKLETIAVGRALALLGYATDGEIASSEEMEEFQKEKEKKRLTLLDETKEKMEAVKNIVELKKMWGDLTPELRENKDLIKLKDNLKNKYANS